jgi:hypothetical protein
MLHSFGMTHDVHGTQGESFASAGLVDKIKILTVFLNELA